MGNMDYEAFRGIVMREGFFADNTPRDKLDVYLKDVYASLIDGQIEISEDVARVSGMTLRAGFDFGHEIGYHVGAQVTKEMICSQSGR